MNLGRAVSPSAYEDRQALQRPAAEPTPWADTARVLEEAELYWLTTVRADGRPHVTPLIGWRRTRPCTSAPGCDEQKARNLEHNAQVALTTGTNTWAAGLDVVVEGIAVRVVDRDELQRLADAYEAKYGSVWHFDVGDGVFGVGRGRRGRVPDRAGEGARLREGAARADHVPVLSAGERRHKGEWVRLAWGVRPETVAIRQLRTHLPRRSDPPPSMPAVSGAGAT